jgi:predicted MFS family arabinose efflux permease
MALPRLKGYEVLRIRNYRLFWLGQWISLIGTWMQSVTQAWLLTRLTPSPLALGFLGAANSAPVLLLVMFGGMLSDHANRRHVIIVTQALMMLQALLLAGLTLAGVVRPWHIIGLAAVLGALNAFDIPARQSFIVELVGPTHLPNAIALNSTGFNVARVVGPAIGGLLVAAVGEGICFLVNGLSYLAVIAGLLMIRTTATRQPARAGMPEPGALFAGVRHVMRHAELRRVLVLVGIISSVAVSYRTFLPAMAREVLSLTAWRYGFLMASAGVGAGAGGLLLAGLRIKADRYRQLLPAGLVLFSLALGAFAMSREYVLSMLLLTLVGCGGIAYFNASNTLVQLSVDDAYRGRVMSLYTLMHQGTATFGSLILGVVADQYGTPVALLGGAVVCLAAVGVFVARGPRVVAVPQMAGPSV